MLCCVWSWSIALGTSIPISFVLNINDECVLRPGYIYKYKIAAAADQYVMHDEHARSFYLRVIKSDAMSDTNVWWI